MMYALEHPFVTGLLLALGLCAIGALGELWERLLRVGHLLDLADYHKREAFEYREVGMAMFAGDDGRLSKYYRAEAAKWWRLWEPMSKGDR